jgi:hypothetical protein
VIFDGIHESMMFQNDDLASQFMGGSASVQCFVKSYKHMRKLTPRSTLQDRAAPSAAGS